MIRMFLTARSPGPTAGRREKSDHLTVEDAKAGFARHPNPETSRRSSTSMGQRRGSASVTNRMPWSGVRGTCDENHSGTSCGWVLANKSGWALTRLCPPGAVLNVEAAGSANVESVTRLR